MILCCCGLLSQAAPLVSLVPEAGVPPHCGSLTVLGAAGTGERVQRLGQLWGMELPLGNVSAHVSPPYFITQLERV